ncbi:MAG: ribbon-helix-helix protein, CopG family [Firmicutes bacterium]|nr:ribbon-helix-helix protein, CopG family [Bacillota bacterium]
MAKFIPTKSEKIVISIRLENEKIEKIDEIANKIDISRNELINQCLDYALNNLEFKGKEKSN